MNIDSKLFFDFKKEYPELLASDVAEYVATKDYETDKINYKNEIVSTNIMKDGKVDYIQFKKNGKVVNNFKGMDIEDMKEETASLFLYEQYKQELTDFVFNKLASK